MSSANNVLIQDKCLRHSSIKNQNSKINKKKVKEIILLILEDHSVESSEVSVLFTDDLQIQELNLQYRGKDKPTDVLSFPNVQDSQIDIPKIKGVKEMLGDIVISVETALEQSKSYGATFEEEVCRLLVHGTLHLLGYDHVNGGRQAGKMKAKEEEILSKI